MGDLYDEAAERAAFVAMGCAPVMVERLGDAHAVQECRIHAGHIWPCGYGLHVSGEVLDAVAPLIAAKALRDAADDIGDGGQVRVIGPLTAAGHLKRLADEIEEKAK